MNPIFCQQLDRVDKVQQIIIKIPPKYLYGPQQACLGVYVTYEDAAWVKW